MKKTLVSALTATFVAGVTATTFAAANPFSDVPADHWAYDSVSKLASEGVVTGYTNGSFDGNSTMTRYEMAQIVAKAMAKQDKVNAEQKAMIDKLSAEFTDELASLGVRVAALESKVDNVKWGGIIRYSADRKVRDGADDGSSNTYQLRLMPQITINDNWTGNARLIAKEANGLKDNNSPTVKVDRLWATGKYDNFTIKIGKLPQYQSSTHGLVMDSAFSGAELSFGSKVKGILSAGRISDIKDGNDVAADYASVEVLYNNGKLEAGAAYDRFANIKNSANLKDDENKLNVIGVGAKYKFDDKWAVQADYARTNSNMNNSGDKNSYNYQVTYGTFKKGTQGTFEVYAALRKINNNDGMNFSCTYDTLDGATKGWVLGTQVGLAKNIYTKVEYFKGKNYNNNDQKKSILFGKVEFIF